MLGGASGAPVDSKFPHARTMPPEGSPSPSEQCRRSRRTRKFRTKSTLPAVRFDAKTTEFTLAKHFESSTPDVSWWPRVESHQGFLDPAGHGKRHYPDFVVITSDGEHWLVKAKKAAGFEWARSPTIKGATLRTPGATHHRDRQARRNLGGPKELSSPLHDDGVIAHS